eukprot:417696-Hanusia_phi.AAC.1
MERCGYSSCTEGHSSSRSLPCHGCNVKRYYQAHGSSSELCHNINAVRTEQMLQARRDRSTRILTKVEMDVLLNPYRRNVW